MPGPDLRELAPNPGERRPWKPAERIAVEVDERLVGDDEAVAERGKRVAGVQRERLRPRRVCGHGGRAYRPPLLAPALSGLAFRLVLVLLPPSQGKSSPDRGRRVGLSTLVYARLRPHRERLIDAVDPALRSAPAVPAAELYTGVLFTALGLADLPWEGVLIASALWGVVRPGDRIPAYRLDMSARPANVGALAAYWREPLRAALPDRGLVLDLRSGSYAAAWQPRRGTHLSVRGLTEAPDGTRTVITHMAKRVRGEVARLVLQAGGAESPEAVAEIVRSAGLRVELSDGRLDVIE